MDENKRVSASILIRDADELADKNGYIDKASRLVREERIICAYQGAQNLLLQISAKTPDDYYQLYDACLSLAIIYYNDRKYPDAAQCYANCIEYLIQNERNPAALNDRTLRKLILRYIDLADALTSLHNIPDANTAMSNALKAFTLIKNKNLPESRIGDPTMNQENFKAFHNYYETQTSCSWFLDSKKFKIHQYLLGDHQQSMREDDALIEDFFSSTSLMDQEEVGIAHPTQLHDTISSPACFKPVLLDRADNDGCCRQMIMDYFRYADTCIQENKRSDAIATYEQVLITIKQIQDVNEREDHEWEVFARNQIKMLSESLKASIATQVKPLDSGQRTIQSLPYASYGSGFFSYAPREDEDSSLLANDIEDMRNSYHSV